MKGKKKSKLQSPSMGNITFWYAGNQCVTVPESIGKCEMHVPALKI